MTGRTPDSWGGYMGEHEMRAALEYIDGCCDEPELMDDVRRGAMLLVIQHKARRALERDCARSCPLCIMERVRAKHGLTVRGLETDGEAQGVFGRERADEN